MQKLVERLSLGVTRRRPLPFERPANRIGRCRFVQVKMSYGRFLANAAIGADDVEQA